VSDQLNQWMAAERQAIEAKRGADRAREAGLLNYAGDQRAKIASGGYRASAEWSGPPRSKLDDFISREVRGIDPDAGTREPAPHVTPGGFDQETEDRLKEEAWASLAPAVQEAGLDPAGPGFADAADAFASAYDQVAAVAKAEQVAFRDSLKAENMRNDPASYGR
jgi:hypothetical protein